VVPLDLVTGGRGRLGTCDDRSVAADDYCYLTTTGRRTGRPHRIEIWYAADGDTLYLLSGGGRSSDWVRNLLAEPLVRVELDGEVRRGHSRLVEGGDEDERARSLVFDKYATRSADDLTGWRQRALPIAIDLDTADLDTADLDTADLETTEPERSLMANDHSSEGERLGAERFEARRFEGEVAFVTGAPAASDEPPAYSRHAFGAQFVEVQVNVDTGEIRVPRMLGVFAVGTIVNANNHDLATYHVPVYADVGDIEVHWTDEHDPHLNPMGSKGIGEIGIVGTAAAVTNAVHHATRIRFRRLPIRLDHVLDELSE
jgi:deazaflavin-dependent oxidoreductase (nitroreductase family)